MIPVANRRFHHWATYHSPAFQSGGQRGRQNGGYGPDAGRGAARLVEDFLLKRYFRGSFVLRAPTVRAKRLEG